MDIEAHWITLISIIIGLALTEMLNNLHGLIRDRTHVRWDPLPLVWAATSLFLVLNYWWAAYLRLDGSDEARTAAEFGLILAPALLLFLTAASILPKSNGPADCDMRAHYESQRKTIIGTFILYQLSTWGTAILVGTLAWNYVTIVRIAILALLASMLIANRRLWDWIGVTSIAVMLLIRLLTQVVR